MVGDWTEEDEIYIYALMISSEKLANSYLEKYKYMAKIQSKIRIPIIVVGSFTGITSFGTQTFPDSFQKWINVGVGIVSVSIACVNAVESFLKIGETTNSSMAATIAFQRLRENINKELSIPRESRTSNGSIFLRDCYTVYQQILIQAPFMTEEVHFVSSPEIVNIRNIIASKFPLTIQQSPMMENISPNLRNVRKFDLFSMLKTPQNVHRNKTEIADSQQQIDISVQPRMSISQSL